MPKEHKKRGRRDEQKQKKRKLDPQPDDHDAAPKRLKKDVEDPAQVPEDTVYQDEAIDGVTRPGAMPYFGLLDDDEQEYFKRADEMLELNQFGDADERKLFLESVYKEVDGKELKIANSQSCSRLMERLILLSTPKQLKGLFQKFSGQ
jgi:nucleolar protein 9